MALGRAAGPGRGRVCLAPSGRAVVLYGTERPRWLGHRRARLRHRAGRRGRRSFQGGRRALARAGERSARRPTSGSARVGSDGGRRLRIRPAGGGSPGCGGLCARFDGGAGAVPRPSCGRDLADRQRPRASRRRSSTRASSRSQGRSRNCVRRRCPCWTPRSPASTRSTARCRRRNTRRLSPALCSGFAPGSSRRSCSPARSPCARPAITTRPRSSACRRGVPILYVYAVGRGEASFLGASPELLLRREGQRRARSRSPAPPVAARTRPSTSISRSGSCTAPRTARRTRSSRGGSHGRSPRTRSG